MSQLHLQAVSTSTTLATIMWLPNVNEYYSVIVYDIDGNSKAYSPITEKTIDGITYYQADLDSLTTGSIYTARVSSITSGVTDYVTFKTLTTTNIPSPSLTIEDAGFQSLNVTWSTLSSSLATGVAVYFVLTYSTNEDMSDPTKIIITNTNATSYLLTGLQPNTYYFQLMSYGKNSSIVSQPSLVIKATASNKETITDDVESGTYQYYLWDEQANKGVKSDWVVLGEDLTINNIIEDSLMPETEYEYVIKCDLNTINTSRVGNFYSVDSVSKTTSTYSEDRVANILLESKKTTVEIRNSGVIENTVTFNEPIVPSLDGANLVLPTSSQLSSGDIIVTILWRGDNPPRLSWSNSSGNIGIFNINTAKYKNLTFSSTAVTGNIYNNHVATALPAITNFKSTVVGSQFIRLSWDLYPQDSRDLIDSLLITRVNVPASSSTTQTISVSKDETTYLDNSVTPGVTYTYTIVPVKAYYPVTSISTTTTAKTTSIWLTGDIRTNYIYLLWTSSNSPITLTRYGLDDYLNNKAGINIYEGTSCYYNDISITPYTDYIYKGVRDGVEDLLYVKAGTISILPPSSLSVKERVHHVLVTWSGSPTDINGASPAYGKVMYTLERSSDNINWTTLLDKTKDLSYVDSDNNITNSYYYRVYASYTTKHVDINSIYVTTSKSYISKLYSVNNFKATTVNNNVILTWLKSYDVDTSKTLTYRIYRQANGGALTLIAEETSNIISYTDINTENNVQYLYAIETYNGYTTSAQVTSAPIIAKLSAPVLTVTDGPAVLINWTKPLQAIQYILYKSTTTESNLASLTLDNSSSSSYRDSNGDEGSTALYSVRAYTTNNGAGTVQSDLSTVKIGTFQRILTYYYIGGNEGSFLNSEDWSASLNSTSHIYSAPTIDETKTFIISSDATIDNYNILTSVGPSITILSGTVNLLAPNNVCASNITIPTNSSLTFISKGNSDITINLPVTSAQVHLERTGNVNVLKGTFNVDGFVAGDNNPITTINAGVTINAVDSTEFSYLKLLSTSISSFATLFIADAISVYVSNSLRQQYTKIKGYGIYLLNYLTPELGPQAGGYYQSQRIYKNGEDCGIYDDVIVQDLNVQPVTDVNVTYPDNSFTFDINSRSFSYNANITCAANSDYFTSTNTTTYIYTVTELIDGYDEQDVTNVKYINVPPNSTEFTINIPYDPKLPLLGGSIAIACRGHRYWTKINKQDAPIVYTYVSGSGNQALWTWNGGASTVSSILTSRANSYLYINNPNQTINVNYPPYTEEYLNDNYLNIIVDNNSKASLFLGSENWTLKTLVLGDNATLEITE